MAKSMKSMIAQAMARVAVAEPAQYAPVKPGVYAFTIKRAQWKVNKSGNGYHLNIGAATDKNRYVWHVFNLINPNPDAQKIAAEALNALLTQMGMDMSQFQEPEDFAKLEGCEFNAYVKVEGNENKFANFSQKPVEVKKFTDDLLSDDLLGEIPF